MALLQYIDFEAPDFGEFNSADSGATLSQTAAAAFPDRGRFGLAVTVAGGSSGVARTRPFGQQVDLCVGLWIKVSPGYQLADGDAVAMLANVTGSALSVILRYQSAWQGLRVGVGDASGTTYAGENLPIGRWVRLAVAISRHASAGSHALWCDGRLVGSAAGSANLGVNRDLAIGAASAGGAAAIAFALDEIKIGQAYADVQPWVAPPRADWPCPERVLIVTRAGQADGEQWGEYYRQARGVPLANWCRVPCLANEDAGAYGEFGAEVETPLAEWLALNSAVAANVTTIVLGYGVPGRFGDEAAASRLTRLGALPSAQIGNPLYDERAADLRRVTRPVLTAAGCGLAYMVHRIDGPSLAAAKQLVDRAIALDAATLDGDGWLDSSDPGGGDYQGLLDAWGASLNCQLLKQSVHESANGGAGSNSGFAAIDHDDWYFGSGAGDCSADFFAAPAGGRALFVASGDFACQTLRGVTTNRWCPRAMAAGYALAAGAVGAATGEGRPSPWPLLEALRRGMTWAEAFIQAAPQLDGGLTPVGDPLATVRFPRAGFHAYRGCDSPDAIDYSTPIAAGPATSISLRIPPELGGWSASAAWYLAVRTVDAAGVQYADPQAIVRVEFDSAGQLAPARPGAVFRLSAKATSGQRLDVAWGYLPERDRPVAERFEIFIGPWQGQTLADLLSGQPAGSVALDAVTIAPSYTWTSSPLAVGTPWRIAVRAVAAGGAAGPAATVIASAQPARLTNVRQLVAEVR